MARLKVRILYSITLISCVWTTLMIYQRFANNTQFRCYENFQTQKTECRPICPHGYFGLPGMTQCHPLLNCKDMENDVKNLKLKVNGYGNIKQIELATWKNYNVTLNTLSPENMIGWQWYFFRGLDNLRNMQPSTKVNQLLGSCGLSFVSEYHPMGSADTFHKLLRSPAYKKYDNTRTRLATCISYIEAIKFLHESPIGTRIFCDTQSLGKTLSQLLLTVDFNVILNDIDDIPEVKSSAGLYVSCGNFTVNAPFVPPEQRGKYPHDEKIDVWKIPDVCDYFLGSSKDILSDKLKTINSRCKSENATMRPSAAQVYTVYQNVLKSIYYLI